jgi:hypothetical protein
MNELDDTNNGDASSIAENETESEQEEDMDGLWHVSADIQTQQPAAKIETTPSKANIHIVCEDAIVSSFAVAIQSYQHVEVNTSGLVSEPPSLAAWQPAPLLAPPLLSPSLSSSADE